MSGEIKTRIPKKEYEDGWNRIFGRDNKYECSCKKDDCVSCSNYNEERIDIIGTNGNDGLHYEETS